MIAFLQRCLHIYLPRLAPKSSIWCRFFFSLSLTTMALAQEPSRLPQSVNTLPGVKMSIILTTKLAVPEALIYAGGRWLTKVPSNFSAFVIQHGEDYLLFDSGLGVHIDEQYRQNMVWWQRPFFGYVKPIDPVRDQLQRAGLPMPQHIILSHSHWDHASGLPDFPAAQVWADEAELPKIQQHGSGIGRSWTTQVGDPHIQWRTLRFDGGPYMGFAQHRDWFGDGSVVLVPLHGHTPGSVGMLVRLQSGKQLFLVGDATWSAAALAVPKPKFILASQMVDDDPEQTEDTLRQLHDFSKAHPEIRIIPAHDGIVQDELGVFPHWLE